MIVAARNGTTVGYRARACYTAGPFSKRLSGMCLILFAYRVRADAPLIVAANRDEFYARPAALAHRWDDAPNVFAGRDLSAGGTWLGVSTNGRFAAVTNFSETPEGPFRPVRAAISPRISCAERSPRARTRKRSTTLAIAVSACCCGTAPTSIYTSNRNSHPRALDARRARAVEYASRRHAVAEGHRAARRDCRASFAPTIHPTT